MRIEPLILKNLIRNQEYTRRTLPFLSPEYFHNKPEQVLFKSINEFVIKYNVQPEINSLLVEIDSLTNHDEKVIEDTKKLLSSIRKETSEDNFDWILDQTEKFCQEKAIYNALMKSISILNEDSEKGITKGAIPNLLSDALAISFDPNIGHSYIDGFEDRYDYYHRTEEKVPFDLEFFNKITRDGLSKKTLNIVMGGTGGGKSLFMCHYAASCLNQGRNVLYITLELAEEEVAKRIDANLMNITIDDLMALSKDMYIKKANVLKSKTNGQLYIKEYPTASAGATHFKALLHELQLKKNFKPDVLIIDYLNICCSSRIKHGQGVNSYSYVKSIAEELRGLAVEFDVPLLSATQTNRTGFVSSDVGLEDTSESFGLPATADFMFALIVSEELDNLGQMVVKQLKNRYNDPTINKRFAIGVDRSKMKIYDVEASAQADIVDSGQVKDDKTDKFAKKTFKGLKV